MASRVNRRQFLTVAAAAGVAASGPFVITRPGWSQTGPIKIGVLEPTSGPVAYIGEANLAGFRFGAERVNAAGRRARAARSRSCRPTASSSPMSPPDAPTTCS